MGVSALARRFRSQGHPSQLVDLDRHDLFGVATKDVLVSQATTEGPTSRARCEEQAEDGEDYSVDPVEEVAAAATAAELPGRDLQLAVQSVS